MVYKHYKGNLCYTCPHLNLSMISETPKSNVIDQFHLRNTLGIVYKTKSDNVNQYDGLIANLRRIFTSAKVFFSSI